MNPASSLLRDRFASEGARVEMVELFFDLVFVFAVTQLSHTLIVSLTMQTVLEASLLMGAVWWAWMYTSWVTNWLDPERIPVRACLFVLMLAALVMSAAIPQAFQAKGLWFATTYVVIQIGRTLFFLWAVRHEREGMRKNFLRILIWFTFSGVFWVTGGLVGADWRMACWGIALLIDMLAPALFFHVPVLGRSSSHDWDIAGGHMAERCALFVIIALGESLLAVGGTFASGMVSPSAVGGFGIAFVSNVAMWWLYFHRSAAQGQDRIARSRQPGRHGLVAYTYLHLPIVAGIIVSAVADHMLLSGHQGRATVMATVGGALLYLFGIAAFKWSTNIKSLPPVSHLAGVLALVMLGVLATYASFPLLAVNASTTVILMVVAVAEMRYRA
ncbi:low temperature requirement protein A [Undibacterium sp. Di26W]|uniref:low temperature requirement protein A n=1 Tax=Undibacterium sp. Di26W TaxID=3413035 RepID=UPI003BF245F8